LSGSAVRRPGARLLVAGALATLVLAAVAARADAYVYWGDVQAGTIGRAANDGSAVQPVFITGAGHPSDVAVDSAHVYWADEAGRRIGRANLDGTGIEPDFIATGDEITGVAVNATHVYWSAMLAGRIGRVALDGSTGFKADLLTGISGPSGVALDSGHLYWSTAGEQHVGRAGLNGSNPEYEFVTIPGLGVYRGVAVSTTSLFFAETGLFGNGTQIGRANVTTGTGVDASFIGNANGPCGMALLGSRIYWANLGANTIGRANTDSSGVDQSLISVGGIGSLCGVAVDALEPPPPPPSQTGGPGGAADTTAPRTTITAGPGRRLAAGVATFRFRSSEPGSTFLCRMDRRKAGRCRSPKRYRRLKRGRHLFRVWATDAAGNKDPTPARRRFRVPTRH
jgi:virginiamycin B lyase